jgi:predicted phage terminase large subunit-like protein
VFTLCGLGVDGKLYIIEIKRGKWTPTELLREAKECWNRWRSMSPPDRKVTLRYMKVEDKQAGQGLIADLQKENNIPVQPVQRGQGQNKYVRHCNCEPTITMRKVMIPETYDEEGSRISQSKWECGTPAAPTDWVLPFLAECDALTVGILMDSESGYDDQYDTLMDAIDDMLDSSSVRNYGALL